MRPSDATLKTAGKGGRQKMSVREIIERRKRTAGKILRGEKMFLRGPY